MYYCFVNFICNYSVFVCIVYSNCMYQIRKSRAMLMNNKVNSMKENYTYIHTSFNTPQKAANTIIKQ